MDKIPDAVIEAMAREMWENSGRQMVADGLDPSFLMPWTEENDPHRENWRSNARTALKAAEAAGWVLVPKEPTEDMCLRGIAGLEGFAKPGNKTCNVWRQMIAAAPKVE